MGVQRTVYQPGEIGQVDWARMPDPIPDAFGKLRPVYASVMALGYSRMLTVIFSFRTRLVDFLRCHAQALEFFDGVPHTVVNDNLKSVVVFRRGAEVTFNPQLLPFADRYGFRALVTWPGEPHERGLVERPIFYVKDNFWYGWKFTGMQDLQAQGNRWRDRICNVRIHSGLDKRPPASRAPPGHIVLHRGSRQRDLPRPARNRQDPSGCGAGYESLAGWPPSSVRYGDPVVAAAMIDRLVHHGEILSLKGDSYRLRDKKLPDHKARSAPATVCVSVNGVISVCSLSFNESRFLPSVHRRQSEGRWLRHNQGLRTGQLAHRLLAACPGRTGQGNSGG